MGILGYLDTILISMIVLLIAAYHGYLYHFMKNKPSTTTYGINRLRRSSWFLHLNQEGSAQRGMLVVQSLRNALMTTILRAAIAILINSAFATVTSATYTASHGHHHHLFAGALFGSKSDKIYAFNFKYAFASFCLLISFFCSSMAIGFLIDANFLMNSSSDFLSESYTETVVERGFALALIANRLLCFSVLLLVWMFGPLTVLLSSLALVCGLHKLDFVPKFPCKNTHKQYCTTSKLIKNNIPRDNA